VIAGVAVYTCSPAARWLAGCGAGRPRLARWCGVLVLRHEFRQFVELARVELRKCVAEPSGDRQTTLVVFIFVVWREYFFGAGPGARLARSAHRAGELTRALRWYVVHAYSNFEHRVRSRSRSVSGAQGCEDALRRDPGADGKEVVEMRDGQKRRASASSIPATWVQMEMDEETWHLVRDVPRCSASSAAPGEAGAIQRKEANQSCVASRGCEQAAAEDAVEPGEWCAWSTGR